MDVNKVCSKESGEVKIRSEGVSIEYKSLGETKVSG